jgi:hypothetical protein
LRAALGADNAMEHQVNATTIPGSKVRDYYAFP